MWRLIPLLQAKADVQMAIDAWLLAKHQQGAHPCCLRFYTWYPAAISLGYHQKTYPPTWHNLVWDGKPIDIVRRPTGGRAVLHQGDLTYTVVTSELQGSLSQTYQQICEFLIQGWQRLGLHLQYCHTSQSYIHKTNCFTSITAADLVTSEGNKFIGSAQLKRGNCILQHGSMPLYVDKGLYEEVFGESPPVLPITMPILTDVVRSLIKAAEITFDVEEFCIEPLSQLEWQEITNFMGNRI